MQPNPPEFFVQSFVLLCATTVFDVKVVLPTVIEKWSVVVEVKRVVDAPVFIFVGVVVVVGAVVAMGRVEASTVAPESQTVNRIASVIKSST